MAMIYLMVILTVIFALASFAIDYGRVQLSKTQLQISTDAAARWAALVVNSGKSAVVARANAAAADNKVNGVAPTFSNSDVVLGKWNSTTRVFTPNATPVNAVKISGTSVIPLMLGNVVNKPSVTVHVSAVARTESISGVIGLSGIDFKNNAFVGSYDSGVNPNPTSGTASSNAKLSSNGSILGEKNGMLKGSVTLGPSGSLSASSWTVTGQTTNQSSVIAAPSMPAWNPSANPGSITNGDYVHNGGTLNGGTYWFNSLTVNGALSFNGPATIYVNGDITMDGNNNTITAYNDRPGNLKMYQLGTGRLFTVKNNGSIKAVLVAPGSAFEANNGLSLYGLAVFGSLTFKNNVDIFFDESAAIEATAALVQ
jgi:Flp pilus assembly protein TadG